VASIVEIASNALRLLGAKPVTSLDDDSERARQVNAFWPNCRDATLRAYPWKFASTRAALGQLAAGPLWEYAYAYQLPTSPWCLRVLRTNLDDVKVPWTLEADRTLVTDATSVSIKYTARITDPGSYDASFESAVTARLACDLAYPVAANRGLAQDMWQLYRFKMQEARFLDSGEASPTGIVSDDLITARLSGGTAFLPIRVIS
jgi:hypothetical protein